LKFNTPLQRLSQQWEILNASTHSRSTYPYFYGSFENVAYLLNHYLRLLFQNEIDYLNVFKYSNLIRFITVYLKNNNNG